MNKSLGKLDPLFHTGAVFVEESVAGFIQFQNMEELMGAAGRVLTGKATQFPRKTNIVDPGHSGDEGIGFAHIADNSSKFVARTKS